MQSSEPVSVQARIVRAQVWKPMCLAGKVHRSDKAICVHLCLAAMVWYSSRALLLHVRHLGEETEWFLTNQNFDVLSSGLKHIQNLLHRL